MAATMTKSLFKFTVIGHACLYVETEDVRLLIDPWLVGSCYWRSWWNYPSVNLELIDKLNPTHIYLSHLHWDHYHGPSLRKFYHANPAILLPRALTTRMVDDMKKDFQFTSIHELDHGKDYLLGPNFSVCSYQFSPFVVDSSLAISCEGVNLLNANDSKLFGLSLKQIISKYKQFDFVFRSHSSASPIPYCVEGINPTQTSRKPEDYTREFIAFSEACNTKYAIPFASSHVYLHEGSKVYNQFYNSPSMVFNEFSRYQTRSKCVLMPSSSFWSLQNGFFIADHDYRLIDNHIQQLMATKRTLLEKEYNKIRKATLHKQCVTSYFQGFISSLPRWLPKLRFGFFLVKDPNLSEHDVTGDLLIIDTKDHLTELLGPFNYLELTTGNSYGLSFVVRTYTSVINDCAKKKMFSTFSASKLLRILPLGQSMSYGAVFTLLDMYENDVFPLSKALSPRQLFNRFLRWREVLDMLYLVYIIKIRQLPLYRLWLNKLTLLNR